MWGCVGFLVALALHTDEQWTLDMVSEAQAREGSRGHGFVEAK